MNLLQKRKLAYGKLELTNHDSAGGKNFAVLTSMQVNRRGMKSGHFLARDGISFLLKGIYNSKYHIRLYKAKNMKHSFVSKLLTWGQIGSPASGMTTR